MSQKSDEAFDRTARRFFQQCEADGEKAYFWYFTTKEVLPDWEYCYIWKKFVSAVQKLYRYEEIQLNGFRVIERQGRGAIHWHAIVNKRLPIDRLLKIGKPLGMGRMGVKAVWSPAGATRYLRDYLTKDAVFSPGVRLKRWATIGPAGHWAIRKNDIIIENDHSRFCSRIRKELFGPNPIPSWLCLAIYRSWHAGYQEREDFIIWHARENWAKGMAVAFEPLNWSVWLIQRECEGVGDRDMDGLIPF